MGDVIVAIQARLSSTRLPGKVLADLCGQPMLQRVWDAVQGPAWKCVVLTSSDPTDDALAAYCQTNEIPCRRGSLDDVLSRYVDLVKNRRPDVVVRVCGDAPFLQKRWIFRALESIEKTGYPVFVPEALHAGTYEHWLDCWNDTPKGHPDREHAGHSWFELQGHTIECVPKGYMTVNTEKDMEKARQRWTATTKA